MDVDPKELASASKTEMRFGKKKRKKNRIAQHVEDLEIQSLE